MANNNNKSATLRSSFLPMQESTGSPAQPTSPSFGIINFLRRIRFFLAKLSQKGSTTITKTNNRIKTCSNIEESDSPTSQKLRIPDKPQLNNFSLNGRSKQFREQMLKDRYILGEMAILGQSTVIYAKPNTGKTLLILHLLTQAIESGEIESENVFYINADDSHTGLTEKLELAEEYGFNMLSPGHPHEQPFKSTMLKPIIKDLIRTGKARNKVLILDTMKKFTDTMSKKAASEFGEVVRAFVLHGGSVVMLAHVNKHRNEEGKLVYAGTSDAVDDSDCAYTIDIVSDENGTRVVSFQNFKKRGAVVESANYQYQNADNYKQILESVIEVDEEQKNRLIEQKSIHDLLSENDHAISIISKELNTHSVLKTNLVRNTQHALGISRKKALKILDQHTGESYENGHRWRVEKRLNNAHYYSLLPPPPSEIEVIKN